MPTARVDIILYIADRNDSRQISLLMNTCCEFFSWPKFLMDKRVNIFDTFRGCVRIEMEYTSCEIPRLLDIRLLPNKVRLLDCQRSRIVLKL